MRKNISLNRFFSRSKIELFPHPMKIYDPLTKTFISQLTFGGEVSLIKGPIVKILSSPDLNFVFKKTKCFLGSLFLLL